MAKTDEAKKLMATVLRANSPTVRPFMAPPATPNDRVQLLRKAFMDTWKVPNYSPKPKRPASISIPPTAPSSNKTSKKFSSLSRHRLLNSKKSSSDSRGSPSLRHSIFRPWNNAADKVARLIAHSISCTQVDRLSLAAIFSGADGEKKIRARRFHILRSWQHTHDHRRRA